MQLQGALEIAVDRVNGDASVLSGYTLNTTIVDTQSDKWQGFSAAQTLSGSGVVAIIGAVPPLLLPHSQQ